MALGDQRTNPYDQKRAQTPSSITRLSAGWEVRAWPQADPVALEQGVDVTDWASVHVIFYGDPVAGRATVIAVRPWRYYASAPTPDGTALREGHWIPDNLFYPAIDPGAIAIDHGSDYVFETHNCERMFWQVLSIEEGVAPTYIMVVPYGYTKKGEPHVTAVSTISMGPAGGGGGGGAAPMPLAFDETLYSNLRGDFTVTRVDGSNFTIVGLTNFIPAAENIYAIGVGAAAGGAMIYRYRGQTLNVTFNEATGIITSAAPLSTLATDNIEILIEGPPRAMDPAFNARREIVVNPDSLHNSTTARIFDQDVIGPLAQAGSVVYYAPFNMAQDGYHQLEAQVRIAHVDGGTDHEENVYVGIEATNDVFPNDLDCTWTDVFDEVFNDPIYAGWMADITNPLDYPLIPVKGLHWRRMRWRITALTTEHEPQDFHVGQARVIIRQTRTAIDAPASVDRRLQLLMQPVNLAMHQEDVGAVSGDYGVLALERRQDTIPASGALDPGADGDYAFPNQTARGNSKCEDPVSADDSTHWSPQDGTTVPTGAGVATITCSGFPFTVDDTNCHIDMVVIKLAAPGIPPNETRVFVNGKGGVSISATNNVITMYGHGYGNFVGTETVYVYLTAQEKGFTAGSNSFRGEDIFPLNMKFTQDILLNNQAVAADPGASYAPSSEGLLTDGYKDISLQLYLIGGIGAAAANRTVTVTIEVSNDAEVPAGTRQWVDNTKAWFDQNTNASGYTSYTSVGNVVNQYMIEYSELNVRRVRVKYDWDADPSVTNGKIVVAAKRKAL